jgi:hypothetical protein
MRLYRLLLMLVLGCSALSMHAQKPLRWDDLADVDFEETYLETLGTVYSVANFSKAIRKLENQRIRIAGYLLPLAVGSDEFALSSAPFAACFFCGQAGPETVMELHLERTESWFAMDRFVLVEGRLRLNADDPDMLYYILEEALVIERLDR